MLNTLELARSSQLDNNLFDLVWKATKNQVNHHNLVYEMIAQGNFVLIDLEKLILSIGNLGARVALYYLILEEQFHFKHQNDHSEEEHCIIRFHELSRMLEAVLERQPMQLQAWCVILEKLQQSFTSQDDLKVKLTCTHQREAVAQRVELTTR